jgi:hypothetical protein
VKEEYTLTADLTGAVLSHPERLNVQFSWREGLLTPTQEVKPQVYQVKYTKGKGVSDQVMRVLARCKWVGVVGALCVLTMGDVVGMLTRAVMNVTTVIAMLALVVQLLGMSRETCTLTATEPKRKRVTPKRDDVVMHNVKCHLPHDPNCEICKRARMRAKNATRNSDRFDIEGSDKGNVWGLDYCGPFPPDVDGNVYFLQGVEVGHSNMGHVALTKSRLASDTLQGFKCMEREHHLVSQHERGTVRVHTDQDTSFEKEFRQDLLDRKVQQTDTGGHRPSANSRTERRIGLVLCTLRAILHVATGGGGILRAAVGSCSGSGEPCRE